MAWRKHIGIYPWHFIPEPQLLESGKPFFQRLLQCIESAEKEIHLQVYIFEPDATGKEIREALLRAAKRGVKIFIWLDAYGSKNFPADWVKTFEENGITISFFSKMKLGKSHPVGLRLHHKIFVFDRKKAMLGGINISDHYSHHGKEKTWLDFGIYTEGDVVLDLLRICLRIEKGVMPFTPKERKMFAYQYSEGHSKVRVLQNHWSKARFGISHQYRKEIGSAKEEIILFASYFLPAPALNRLLKKAARRGVKVVLVLSGKSDVKLMRIASQFLYHDLLKSGVEIREWRRSVMHAKMALIDGNWMSIGSYNLNHLSDFGSVECNLEIQDKHFFEKQETLIRKHIVEHTHKVEPREFKGRMFWFWQLVYAIAYRIIRGLLRLLFYLQREPRHYYPR